MEAALDDVAFLANSANRVAVFETIVESPRSSDEVHDQVDASLVTMSSVLIAHIRTLFLRGKAGILSLNYDGEMGV